MDQPQKAPRSDEFLKVLQSAGKAVQQNDVAKLKEASQALAQYGGIKGVKVKDQSASIAAPHTPKANTSSNSAPPAHRAVYLDKPPHQQSRGR